MNPAASFADRVHRWTFTPRSLGRAAPPAAVAVARQYRQMLRRAERYVLDDDAVALLCEISGDCERLDEVSVLARLPFDTVWIEYSLHHKNRVLERLGRLQHAFDPAQVSPVVGILLYRDEPGGQRWVAHEFCEINGSTIIPQSVAMVFDPDGRTECPTRGSVSLRLQTLSLAFPDIRVPAKVGTHEISITPEAVYAGDLERGEGTSIVGSPWTVDRTAAVVDPFWAAALARKPEVLVRALVGDPMERAGELRWLVSILAAMNGLPRDVRPRPQLTGAYTVGPNVLPYLQTHTLTLRIPRDNRVVWARKHLAVAGRNARRPWHRVAGHWRVIERGRTTGTCHHIPTMIEGDLAMCECCQLVVRWIADHARGGPTIGVVEHERHITT